MLALRARLSKGTKDRHLVVIASSICRKWVGGKILSFESPNLGIDLGKVTREKFELSEMRGDSRVDFEFYWSRSPVSFRRMVIGSLYRQ